jgi:predicted PurR-regulated permease PerM
MIPYIGPFMGGALGTVIGLVLKYTSATPIGLDVSFWTFAIILIAIFCVAQFVDNMICQPLIYSTGIKSTPLEIFLVLMIVSNIGGPFAMIVAVPTYTIFRVIAFRFFGHVKAIKRLIPDEKLISVDKED